MTPVEIFLLAAGLAAAAIVFWLLGPIAGRAYSVLLGVERAKSLGYVSKSGGRPPTPAWMAAALAGAAFITFWIAVLLTITD